MTKSSTWLRGMGSVEQVGGGGGEDKYTYETTNVTQATNMTGLYGHQQDTDASLFSQIPIKQHCYISDDRYPRECWYSTLTILSVHKSQYFNCKLMVLIEELYANDICIVPLVRMCFPCFETLYAEWTVAATVSMWCRFNLGSNWKSPPIRVQSRSYWRLGRLSIESRNETEWK